VLCHRRFTGTEPAHEFLIDGRNRLDALTLLGWLGPKCGDGPLKIRNKRALIDASTTTQFGPFETKYDASDDVIYRYVIAANIQRRHLTTEQKRDLIAELLKADPSKSDRQIAKQTKTSPTTVGTVRAEKEASGDVSKLDTRTDTKGRKQPSKKTPDKVVSMTGQPIDLDKLGPAAQEQIAVALAPEPEPKSALASPAMPFHDKPWLAHAAEMEAAIEAKCDTMNAPLDELEKQLQSIITTFDVAEKAAANLIFHMVRQRKQTIKSVAKLIGKDPKWIKEKFELAKPVLEAAE
jgi:hypothetical protein